MPQIINCVHCQQRLTMPDSAAGKTVRCPLCQGVFTLPAASEPISDPPPAPRSPAGPGEEWVQREERPSRSASSDFDVPGQGAERDEPDRGYEDEDEPPRRRRSASSYREEEDDDSDDRPRRRRRGRDDDYGYGSPHRGDTIMVLGLLGMLGSCVCCLSLALSIPAVTMAHTDLAAMDRGDMDPSGAGNTRAGQIMGYIGIGITILSTIAGVLMQFAQPRNF